VLSSVLKTHSAQHGSDVIEWNTYDEYCDILLTIGVRNNQACTAVQEYMLSYLGRCHPDAKAF
jgi:hypothetical protein